MENSLHFIISLSVAQPALAEKCLFNFLSESASSEDKNLGKSVVGEEELPRFV